MLKEGYLTSAKGMSTIAIIGILACFVYVVIFMLNINVMDLIAKLSKGALRLSGKFVKSREDRFSREYKIGIIDKKKRKYKIYKFFDELTIDLGLKQQGVSPYELIFLLTLLSLFLSTILSVVIFGNVILAFFSFPIVMAAVVCGFYTKANIAHDARIEAVIEAENIVCNNIQSGVKIAVQNSFDSIPRMVQNEFKDFLNDLTDMMYISTALLKLGNSLGSVSDDFIQKCIKFETAEEHGTAGIFQDLVEMNNIRTQLRIKMKRAFEQVVNEFVIGAAIIVVFLVGVMAIYPVVRNFYLKNAIGQIILMIDFLIFIGEFVFITYLRAQEL